MASTERWTFDLCGGHLALDFANTVSNREWDEPIERLLTFEDVIAFGEQTRLLSGRDARRLEAWAHDDPRAAERLHARIVELREALYVTFAATVEGRPVPTRELAVLNAWAHRPRLGPDLSWEWDAGPEAPDAMMLPIVRAAVDLGTSPDRGRVRICDAEDCVWLFFDASKNRSRRWCDMNQCGNRVKARRHYEKAHPPTRGLKA